MNGGSKPDFSCIRTVDGLDVKGKRVLVRVDFNVPMQDGEVTDTTRITRVLPTVKQLANGGAKVIVLSHLGRPKGQRSPETSLAPVAAKVAELMGGTKVHFIKDCVGEEAKRGVDALKPGEVACSKTCATTLAKRRTTSASPSSLPSSATSMSTMLSPPPTGRMLPLKASRIFSQPMQAS
jgi:phosphoglycerate kinase